ncbi:DUF6017 domain-containing protein [Intestinimonas butyriciproducens]|uniref:Replication initiator protein A n=1 Tax=Intestinimonas butyriciproducens TaxID=1297617 RepID=A0A2U1CBZ2_9FIRM|nr:DUF6017 domain-containing protein [Intestinimonas butyriciproducens]MCR1906248.1 replication initiator protein A [Intestinimonas butyriciproducens]PVY58438.1 replication initiator protein A [Intestinimonas butyriciproducens]QBB65457.1 putative replication initiation protein [Intestinimonas butyriciproducens]
MSTFDYFYGGEAEQYSFYRIPRTLIIGERFKGVSTDAKLLYGLMLDRMGLSFKNGWLDDNGRVFIYYSLDDIQTSLGCAHQKACKLLAELDTSKGIGLIERKKQGQGKPARIYVKRFYTQEDRPTPPSEPLGPGTGAPDFSKSEPQSAENQKSRLPLFRSADFSTSSPNYTYPSQPYSSQPYPSIYPPCPPLGRLDGWDRREEIKEQIGYGVLSERYGTEDMDELVELLADVLGTTRPTVRIGGEDIPTQRVQERFTHLDFSHVEYVFDALAENTTKIRNIRAYLLTALYRAPTTKNRSYQTQVQHDMYGGP